MPVSIEIRGLDQLMARMQAYPDRLRRAIRSTMDSSLLTLWENVPSYPPPPENSRYRRTGNLGRSLGSGMEGGRLGNKPDIYEVKQLGAAWEGRFGSELEYAPHVIGDNTQADVHAGRWWTIKNIAERAKDKIITLWNNLGSTMAAFLEGRGL